MDCDSEMEKREIWVGDEDGCPSPSSSNFFGSSVSEIIEEDQDHGTGRDEILSTINEESGRINGSEEYDDNVYVAVGKSDTSMDALRWALKNALKPSSTLFLIHVFPEIKYVATPLGKLPKSQANTEQLETCMLQERSKRMILLQRFLRLCSRVRFDTILIESDETAKAVVDLIPVLNIRKLVLGTNKSSLKKLRRKGIADVVQREAPEFCEVNIICEGKEVSRQMMMATPSHSPFSPRPDEKGIGGGGNANANVITKSPRHGSQTKNHNRNEGMERHDDDDLFSLCMCFTVSRRKQR